MTNEYIGVTVNHYVATLAALTSAFCACVYNNVLNDSLQVNP